MSLNTASHVLAPAETRKAAVLSASPAALMLGSVLLPRSMPDDHIEACIASNAFGAYVSRKYFSVEANPTRLSGNGAASAKPEDFTIAETDVAPAPAAFCCM